MADQPAKKAKRRVKDPETFRERAQKASEGAAKPKRRRLPGRNLLAGIFGPVGRSTRKLFGHKVFKPARVILRFIGKIIFIGYLSRSWQELKLVAWPSRKDSRRLTVAVLVFALVFGAAVAAVDWGLDKAFKQLLLK